VAGRQSSAQGQVSTTSAGAEMSMEEDGEDNSGAQPEMDKALKGILGEYFSLQRALYGDSLDAAAESAATLGSRLEELTSIEVPGQPHFWHQKPDVSSIRGKAKEIAGSRDLDSSRTAFGHLSVALESLIRVPGGSRRGRLAPAARRSTQPLLRQQQRNEGLLQQELGTFFCSEVTCAFKRNEQR